MSKIFSLICILITSILISQNATINSYEVDNYNKYQEDISAPGLILDVLEETINPDNYLVGPGDQFAFNMLSADGMVNLNLMVTPTGEILIPAVGKIMVDGKTLSETIIVITEQCHNKYSNAAMHIALTKIRKFRVLVIGPVTSPGFTVVSPLMRISDIFKTINEKIPDEIHQENKLISQRNIILWRDNKPIQVDLIKFNMFGVKSLNPQLKQGDVIEFGLQEKFVGIFGGVKLPGKYELVDKETLFDLIQISGGFTKNADFTRIEVTRFISDIDKINIVVDSINEANNFILQDEDHINIRIKKDYKRQDLVIVTGEVNYPGTYSIEPNVTTVGDVIKNCGGLSSKADISKIQVNNYLISKFSDIEMDRIILIPEEYRSDEEKAYMKARARSSRGMMASSEINFTKQILNFPLNRGDEVNIPEALEYVEILGAVVHPGRYPFFRNYSADNYIQLAGGTTDTATRNKYIVKQSTGHRIPITKELGIENGDVIFIAEKLEYSKWERFKEIMAVTGQAAALIMVVQNALGK